MLRTIKKIWHASIIFAISIFFVFCLIWLFVNPISLTSFLGEKLNAAVNISNSASVQVNPINQLAAQLQDKEKKLADMEDNLNNRALAIERENSVWRNRVLLGILAALVIIFILLLINFYFDSQRNKELEILEKEEREKVKP